MEQKEKVNIFSKPEDIDKIIKLQVNSMPSKGGKCTMKNAAWPDYLLELRRQIVISYITENGLSKEKTAQQLANRWGVAMSTARLYVSDAIKNFVEQFKDETIEEQKRVWLERCEQILSEAIDSGDKSSALKALDLLGKVGVYVNKTDVNVSGEIDMKFDFQ